MTTEWSDARSAAGSSVTSWIVAKQRIAVVAVGGIGFGLALASALRAR